MRTNIVIDDMLMDEAMAAAGASTKRETVETALKELVRIHRQKEALDRLRGSCPDWDGDIDMWRRADAPVDWDIDPA